MPPIIGRGPRLARVFWAELAVATPGYIACEWSTMNMRDESDSSDRKQVDYFLFSLPFASFVVAGGGVIISSPLLALAGAMILVSPCWVFCRCGRLGNENRARGSGLGGNVLALIKKRPGLSTEPPHPNPFLSSHRNQRSLFRLRECPFTSLLSLLAKYYTRNDPTA